VNDQDPDFAMASVATIEEIEDLPVDTVAVQVNRLDDQKLKALSRLSGLLWLGQDGSSVITDEGVRYLQALTQLETLDLEWSTSLTDRGLEHLRTLRNLRWLDLGFCPNVTDAGVNQLKAALPHVEIER